MLGARLDSSQNVATSAHALLRFCTGDAFFHYRKAWFLIIIHFDRSVGDEETGSFERELCP